MKYFANYKLIIICFLALCIGSCESKQEAEQKGTINQAENESSFKLTLKKHLDAVSNKDLEALKTTMSPQGEMELIQPGAEIVYSVDGFLKFHQEWFNVPNWTFETKIVSTDIGDKIGVATTEIVYREPERNGKPYFNRMSVSYTLEKIDNHWYIIKDHASTIEKTK